MLSKESESVPTVELIYQPIYEYDKSFKIIIVGDCRVGKTSLINATVGKTFQKENIETPGCQFCPFGAKIDNKIIKFKIFDMSGKEMYKTLVQSYLKNSSLIILVYDITNRKSFENIDTWINDIKSVTEKGKNR